MDPKQLKSLIEAIEKLVKLLALPSRVRPRLLSVDQAAAYLSISPKTIRNGLGPKAPDPFPVKPKRAGKRVLFDIKDLDAFVDSMTRE
jgi:hypothetical protein